MRFYLALRLACGHEHSTNCPRTGANFFFGRAPHVGLRLDSCWGVKNPYAAIRRLAKQTHIHTHRDTLWFVEESMAMCANFHKESNLSECPRGCRILPATVIMSSIRRFGTAIYLLTLVEEGLLVALAMNKSAKLQWNIVPYLNCSQREEKPTSNCTCNHDCWLRNLSMSIFWGRNCQHTMLSDACQLRQKYLSMKLYDIWHMYLRARPNLHAIKQLWCCVSFGHGSNLAIEAD